MTGQVLLLLTGLHAPGSPPWRLRVPGFDRLRVNDSDEHGVPSNADTAWRQSTLQRWVRLAIDLDGQRIDLLVTGQSPLGDLLAVPEATQVDIAVCLLDVDDPTSVEASFTPPDHVSQMWLINRAPQSWSCTRSRRGCPRPTRAQPSRAASCVAPSSRGHRIGEHSTWAQPRLLGRVADPERH